MLTRRRVSRCLIAVTVLAVPVAVGRVGASPPGVGGFVASASAQAVRATFETEGFLIVSSLLDGGGPVAQAVLNSLEGRSFASLPYPGETVLAAPGLAAASGGPSLPPLYPFYVSASQTDPEQGFTDPGGLYALNAAFTGQEASGDARLTSGPASEQVASQQRATAATTSAGDAVVATAESVVEGVSVANGALRIASVRSKSVTRYAAGSPPASTSELAVSGGQAGALTFGYGPEGLTVASQGVPLPSGEGVAALNEALAPSGASIRLVTPEEVAGGTSSEVLEVVHGADLPGGGRGIARLRFGGTTSAVTAGEGAPDALPLDEVAAPDAGGSVAEPGGISPDAAPPAAPVFAGSVAAPAARPGLGAPRRAPAPAASSATPPMAADVPVVTPAVPAAAEGSLAAPVPLGAPQPVFVARDVQPVTAGYVVIALMAALAVAVSWVWKRKGAMSL